VSWILIILSLTAEGYFVDAIPVGNRGACLATGSVVAENTATLRVYCNNRDSGEIIKIKDET
jgi:hypothetical protein